MQSFSVPQTGKNSLQALFFPAGRRRDIDGLRGLAVLLVMFFHAGWISGGFIGVDIFIVISGYFMGRSAFMQHPFQAARFISRRVYRLLPALLCMIVIVCGGMLWWVLQSDRADIALNGAYALVYFSNVWAAHHVGYFEGQAIAYPFLHSWSLSLEMQFYTIIFLIALLLPRLRFRRWALFAILTLSFLYSIAASYRGDHSAYYDIFARLWEFALGTLIWFLPPLPASAILSAISYAAGAAVLLLCGMFYTLSDACPSVMAVLPCAATMLIIMQPRSATRRVLEPLSPIGVISYSLYLWHWPAIVLAAYLLSFQISAPTMMLVLVGACAAGTVSYLLVERPMLTYEGQARPVTVQRGACALASACALAAAILALISHVSRVH